MMIENTSDNFGRAHAFTASWEGGLSDHPADSGGITAYGVSLSLVRAIAAGNGGRAFLAGLGLPLPAGRETVLAIGQDEARRIFRREFWDGPGLDGLPFANAALIYDAAVNCGQAASVRFVQAGVNRCLAAGSLAPGWLADGALAVDGIAGPRTRHALRAELACVIDAALGERRAFYRRLAEKKPGQGVFLRGWLNRAAALAKFLGRPTCEA